MKAFLSYKSVVLAAGQTIQHGVTGALFFCRSCTAPFKLGMDSAPDLDLDQGFVIRAPAGDFYRYLTFNNPNAYAITINYYAGNELIDYAPIVISAKVPDTYMTGQGPLSDAAVTLVPYNGADRQKQVIVTNAATMVQATIIYVHSGGATGPIVGVIWPQSAWTIETSEALTITNTAPGVVNFYVSQVFYKA